MGRVWALCLVLLAYGVLPAAAEIKLVRLGVTEQRTRLVIEAAPAPSYKLFTLSNPYRVVVDLQGVKWPDAIAPPKPSGLIKNIRFGQFTADTSRVVIETHGAVAVQKDFTLKPMAGFDGRIVIDLAKSDAARFRAVIDERRGAQTAFAPMPRPVPDPAPPRKERTGKPVIVIDAGHGGLDPGARGRRIREKDIVLSFAREFATMLRRTGRYRVYLTRRSDIYLPLRERVAIARRRQADLFISVHADAIRKRHVRGMSIYTLSEKASDAEAAALARKENQADILAGMDFDDYEPVVGEILTDMAQRETQNKSIEFAEHVVKTTKRATRLLDRPHRFAGFRVLKAPDVPSVLVELGFLTNRNDEAQLMSRSWRRKVAHALTKAIDGYFF